MAATARSSHPIISMVALTGEPSNVSDALERPSELRNEEA